MSLKVSAAVWARSKARGAGRLVLLSIADHANDAGYAFPSITRLTERTRLTRESVTTAIKDLEGLGELRVIRPEHRGGRQVNRYHVIGVSDWSGEPTTPTGRATRPHDARVVGSVEISGRLGRREPLEPSKAMAMTPEVRDAYELLEENGKRIGWRLEATRDIEFLMDMRAKYPTRDLVQAVTDLLDGDRIRAWRAKYRNLESFLANANDVDTQSPSRSADEIRHGLMLPGDATRHDHCEVCATRTASSAGR